MGPSYVRGAGGGPGSVMVTSVRWRKIAGEREGVGGGSVVCLGDGGGFMVKFALHWSNMHSRYVM